MRKLTTAELVAAKPPPEAFQAAPRFPIYVVCDNIRSLANVGQIFRLCDAARVAHLYLCGITGYPALPADPRPPHVAESAFRGIAKTAIDTHRYVPWSYHESVVEVIRDLKAAGVQIVALEQTTESIDCATAAYRLPSCVVIGHERSGLAEEVLSLADLAVAIPMYGIGNSLNAAQACTIAVYELLRRFASSGEFHRQ